MCGAEPRGQTSGIRALLSVKTKQGLSQGSKQTKKASKIELDSLNQVSQCVKIIDFRLLESVTHIKSFVHKGENPGQD